MKAVVDRIVQYANRYQLTNVETSEVLGTFDFDEVTGSVQQVGTEIDAELFQSIADDLAARIVANGGELKNTVVTFTDTSGTAANVASGDKTSTLWSKVKNWFSRLKALAFKDKISNTDVADDAAIAQSKVSGLESALAEKANDSALATIAKTGNLADATEDSTHRTVTDAEKATWNAKQSALTFDSAPTADSTNPVTSGGVKTALDAKQATITGAASSVASNNLTARRAVVSDASGKVAVSDVTIEELEYLSGADRNIQAQIEDIKDGTTPPEQATKAAQDEDGNNIVTTYATKDELTTGLEGKQPTGNYALQTGTYPNMTVGNATNAVNAVKAEQDGNGDNIANTYVTKTTPLRGILYANTDLRLSEIIGNTSYWNRAVEILPTDYEIKVGDIFIDRLGSVGVVTNSNTSSGSVAIRTISTTSVDGDGNDIVDTYVDKASEQVITGRKVFYGDKAPLNVKYKTQETGNTFSYAPVTFYDNADKKLGAVQGQKTGNGTVQAEIDLYDKDGNYAASMGLKWDYSTQKAFPFAPSGQNVVPNGDSSDKIVCSEFLQGTTIYSSVDGIVTNTGYRGKNYNIALGSTTFMTGQDGNIYVERSGNVVNIFGWLRNHSVLNNGTAYVLLSGLPKAISGAMGVAPCASMNGVCRAYINAGGRELYFTPSFLVDATTIAAMSWFSICMTYITNE